jgi:TRAP-type C4-dicarboxylate transport system substrate-binding protein
MSFEELLFDDFESVLKLWSDDTGKRYSKELEDDDTITYIYDYKSFRHWYHTNNVMIDREILLSKLV